MKPPFVHDITHKERVREIAYLREANPRFKSVTSAPSLLGFGRSAAVDADRPVPSSYTSVCSAMSSASFGRLLPVAATTAVHRLVADPLETFAVGSYRRATRSTRA